MQATRPRALLAGMIVSLLAIGIPSAATAETEQTSSPSPYVEGMTIIEPNPEPDRKSDRSVRWMCLFTGEGDDVHVSTNHSHISQLDASGHAWWEEFFGWCPEYADVTIQLQQLMCYQSLGICYWDDAGHSSERRVREGGGSANRVNGRTPCHSTDATAWRIEIDVDLVDMSDSPNRQYTDAVNINCRYFD